MTGDDAGGGMAARGATTIEEAAGHGAAPLLEVRDLRVDFRRGRQVVQAVAGVSFTVGRGETLGLVGESGCGKSTTGRAVVQLARPTSGSVAFDGTELTTLGRAALRRARTGLQMVFQDPASSLNPRRRVGGIVAEPLDIWRRGTPDERRAAVRELLAAVGLDPDAVADRRPGELSGGQCQRVSIARALVLQPALLVCDEVVSALDVSVQAQILNLLEDLKARYGLALLFIAHDLAVVRSISDRVAVMYLGRLCEVAPADALYRAPAHPYSAALLDAARQGEPAAPARRSAPLAGEPPDPAHPPSGCRFRTRCPRAEPRCADEEPPMREVAPGHTVACHFPLVGPAAPSG